MTDQADTPPDSQPPAAGDSQTTTAVPQAIVQTAEEVAVGRLQTRLWWLTGVCAALAVGLVVTNVRTRGRQLTLHFAEGHGLKAGDALRYRGIDIGRVDQVALAEDLSGIRVAVSLQAGSEKIAVEGSQFWIQRARLRIGQISGLDTVLGAKYIGVLPGEPTAEPRWEFTGTEAPLALTEGDAAEILVQFPAGEGIEVGDPVRYRGIAVGEVVLVELSSDGEAVDVRARLVGAARKFAKSGTQFWIERPRIDLTEVRGLETLLGGRYIALQPGPDDRPMQTAFVGLSQPPPLPRSDGVLEVELDAPRQLGIVRGAPVTYRGLEVGRVAHVGLSKDGASVKMTAVVDSNYTELVRANSKWWSTGGIQLDASLRGVNVSMESLSAWIRGGVAFATPPEPGEPAVTGHRFMLEVEPQPEWLEWQPRIAVGNFGSAGNSLGSPTPVRVVASWKASLLGLYRRRTIETWGVALNDGTLHVPIRFIDAASKAGKNLTLEASGAALAYSQQLVTRRGLSGTIQVPSHIGGEPWPVAQLLAPTAPVSTLLVINPELNEPLAIDMTRVSADGRGWNIAPGIAIAAPLEGSPVTDLATGKLAGMLVLADGVWRIESLAPAVP